MTRKQAQKLLEHHNIGNVVVFNGGPYVTKAGSSNITEDLIYSDDTYSGFPLTDEDPKNFDVYLPIINWWE